MARVSAGQSSRMQSLLHAPIAGMTHRLAAPNVVATLIMTASTFADAWFVGWLGTAALASLADVREGWEPLCAFLAVMVPDAPFPRTNSSKQFVEDEWARDAT